MNCHRIFFAFRPPRTLAEAVYWSAERYCPGRRVRPEHLHVTLNISDDYADFPQALADKMAGIAGALPLNSVRVLLDRVVGTQSSVALCASQKSHQVLLLQRQIEGALRNAGIPPRMRWRFSPHMTLVYRAGQPFSEAIDPIGWVADELVLIHSHVGRTRHDILGRWALPPRGDTPLAA